MSRTHAMPPRERYAISAGALTTLAHEIGLDLAAAAPVGATPTWDAYRDWAGDGYAGGMDYLTRPDAIHRRRDPRHIMPSAKSVLVVASSYAGPPPPDQPHLHGRVSRYVWGAVPQQGVDYHHWLLTRLKRLIKRIQEQIGHPQITSRAYVDTGPVLERAWARAAGLGWIGKNGALIHPRLGSLAFLGVALLDVDIEPSPPVDQPNCGSCTRCIDACPTGAIIAPGVLDARRCLSYLTIEHRGAIPQEYRRAIGNRVFGCDTCQEVCPWNRHPLDDHEGDQAPELATLDLVESLTLDADDFRARYRRTPIWRATPDGLARNAAIVLGNLGADLACASLESAATHHPSAMVREAASWALQEPS